MYKLSATTVHEETSKVRILGGASEVTADEIGCATNMPRPAPDAPQQASSAEFVRCRGEMNVLRGFIRR